MALSQKQVEILLNSNEELLHELKYPSGVKVYPVDAKYMEGEHFDRIRDAQAAVVIALNNLKATVATAEQYAEAKFQSDMNAADAEFEASDAVEPGNN